MKPVVGIIGGLGQMGQWFSRFFTGQGLEVLIGEPGLTPTCPEVAARADVVVISVPLHLTEAIIAELAPYIRPEALFTDLTSLKQGPMAAMLEHFPGKLWERTPSSGQVRNRWRVRTSSCAGGGGRNGSTGSMISLSRPGPGWRLPPRRNTTD